MKPARRARRLRALAPAVALLLGSMGHAAAAAPKTHTVAIEGTRFQPASLTVRPGDAIVWINKDPFPHTVTSPSGSFDSRQIDPGRSWTYRTTANGDFAYFCSLHPTMTAAFRVEPGGAGTRR